MHKPYVKDDFVFFFAHLVALTTHIILIDDEHFEEDELEVARREEYLLLRTEILALDENISPLDHEAIGYRMDRSELEMKREKLRLMVPSEMRMRKELGMPDALKVADKVKVNRCLVLCFCFFSSQLLCLL
jgi:hypothetical protein